MDWPVRPSDSAAATCPTGSAVSAPARSSRRTLPGPASIPRVSYIQLLQCTRTLRQVGEDGVADDPDGGVLAHLDRVKPLVADGLGVPDGVARERRRLAFAAHLRHPADLD